MIPLSQLLLRALRKLILRFRGSVQAVLLLIRGLERLIRRGRLSRDRRSGLPGEPSIGEIPLDGQPSSTNTTTVCASRQPRLDSDHELPYSTQGHPTQTPVRPSSYHGSPNPLPYIPNISRSSPNLGGTPLRDFSTNNLSSTSHLSTTSIHPHPRPRSRPLSPSPSQRHIPQDVSSPLHRSDSPVLSMRGEDPDEHPTAPPELHNALTPESRKMFPMAPPWIERYKRDFTMYPLHYVQILLDH